MVFAGMESAMEKTPKKILGFYLTQLVINAARKLVVGKGE